MADGQVESQGYFYARWGPPDEYTPGTRLEWPGGGPLLAVDPALIDGGWPGLPLGIWRVADARLGADIGGIRGDAFTIVERLPSWRWLGVRGDELLAIVEEAVDRVAGAGSWHTPLADRVLEAAVPRGRPSMRTLDPATHAAAHFTWLLRDRLLAEARRLDPGGIYEWLQDGCDGPMSWQCLTGRWAEVERDAIADARAVFMGDPGNEWTPELARSPR